MKRRQIILVFLLMATKTSNNRVPSIPVHAQRKTRPVIASKKAVSGGPLDWIDEFNAQLPADAWSGIPTDGSINLDHYLYGAPKA